MRTIKEIIKEHLGARNGIIAMAKMDIKKNYSGSTLGWLWAIIRPAIIIFVYWFAFSMGLRRGKDIDGHPFFLWLIAGMIPWFYMRDMINTGSNCFRKYKVLVTKIRYPISTIPTVISISTLAVHIGLLLIMMLIFILFGYYPSIYYLELPIYMAMMFLFFTTFTLFSGMLTVVSKDWMNLVKSLTQALFWLSGILYNAKTIENELIRKVLMFNPVTIIATGYRNVFVTQTWFWEEPEELRNFVIVFLLMLILAILVYRKLRKIVPDVL